MAIHYQKKWEEALACAAERAKSRWTSGHNNKKGLATNITHNLGGDGHEIAVSHGCVQAVLRALSILKCLAQDRRGMTLTEIVRGTSLAPSTAHRLLTTLQSEGFVQFEPNALRWLVGPGAHLVGVAFHSQRPRPFL
ncbi:helix-turn-helix domain-containing protein [Methylobacterium nodulans]|uniref:helix-turn-helix domain-containing protein n=1 Tax=Methylobacterium nodulans TaxID=114616 RepID=UPI0009FF10D7|nr:helix-turn-helix domain-containing protein [Methylobacterium nodulans]